MRIAIIDDEEIFQMQIKMMIQKLSSELEIDFSIDTFSNGPAFIEAIQSCRYDIVFMDIYMPDMDGIETATKMRELTERTFLIFMTASDGHYPDAFSLHAFDYVTKPVNIDRINKVLKEVLDHTPMDEAFIKINVGSIEQKVYLRQIVTATTDGHYLDINLDDESQLRVRMTAKEFADCTDNDKRFISINRGIIVNMDAIEDHTDSDVYMCDGTTYPINSRKYASIVQQIKDYQFSKTK